MRFSKAANDRDEEWAKEQRERSGRAGRLVSWEESVGGWLARVSCGGWSETVEARAPTRRQAIVDAECRLKQICDVDVVCGGR